MLKKDNLFYLKNVTSQVGIDILYDLIFNQSDYTHENYIEDSNKHNFPTTKEIPYFEFVVRYELGEKGLQTTIINDSIHETAEFQIAYIDVLPFFRYR